MDKYNTETIIYIHHWTDDLFSFISTRNKSYKFINGEFTLMGIFNQNKIITRAYSIVSSNYDDYLEFFSIKVPKGLLTSKLRFLKKLDKILIGKKTAGTLIINNLLINGKILWLISTGTGLAPFISIIKDFNIYINYDLIILTHTTKYEIALSYRYYICNDIFMNENFFNFKNKFIYYPTLTKENFINNGRITDIIKNNKLFNDLNLTSFSINRDRIMICGSNKMLKDIIEILNNFGLKESKINDLGHYVIERSFVD